MAGRHPAIEKLANLTKPGNALTPQERWETDIACESAKEALAFGVQELVFDANRSPMMTSKSCDGTPMSLVHRSQQKLPSGKKVRSQGKQGVEWLVQNQFFRTQLATGEWVTRVLLSEPCMLKYGKACEAILSLAFKNWRTLRSLGHFGCSVEHYLFYRVGYTKMERLIRQLHADTPSVNLPPRHDT